MRKILFLCLIFVGMAGMAQIKVASYVAFAGTTTGANADTLHPATTRSYTFELANYDKVLGVNVALQFVRTSGTITTGVKVYWSNEGTYWPETAADSVTITGASASEYWTKNYTPQGGRYMKVKVTNTTAVQLSSLKGYLHVYKK